MEEFKRPLLQDLSGSEKELRHQVHGRPGPAEVEDLKQTSAAGKQNPLSGVWPSSEDDVALVENSSRADVINAAPVSGRVPESGHVAVPVAEDLKQSCATKCGLSSPTDDHDRSQATSKLIKAVGFCLVFMVLEVVGGIWANSLAILTDAAHLLSDVAGFAISLFAIWAASWEATPRQSYGFYRLEILGALLSIQIIWLITGILVYEAIDRLLHSSDEVNGKLMFCIAACGLLVNLSLAFLLDHGHSHGHSHGESGAHGLGHGHNHSHSHSHGVGTGSGSDGRSEHQRHDNGRHHCHGSSHSHAQHQDSTTDKDHDHSHDHEHDHVHKHDHAHESLQGVCVPSTAKDGVQACTTIKVDQDIEHEGTSAGNINVRGAYLHVLGDLIQSIGVMVAGAIIWYKPEWRVVDLLCTLLFSVVVLATTIRMLRDIVEVLMESTPREIDATKLEKGIMDIEHVIAVHELHIWAITVGKTLLACHVMIEPGANYTAVLDRVVKYCERDFKISHVTVQIEVGSC